MHTLGRGYITLGVHACPKTSRYLLQVARKDRFPKVLLLSGLVTKLKYKELVT